MSPHVPGRSLTRLGARISELHPRIWQVAWWLPHKFKFLLPHDPAYHALRHFIAAAPKGLFLDVGANDGISALSFRRFDHDYRIFSLEPNVLLEPNLRQLKGSDPNFDYRMIGAGSAAGKTILHIPSYRGVLLHTFTSADAQQVKQGVQAVFGASIARRTDITPIEGQIVRVDDLCLAPTIVKIDTEGFDYDVLVGMQETIARSRPFMMIELSWSKKEKIIGFLEAQRYSLHAYDVVADSFRSDIEGAHRNCFAIPDEKPLPHVSLKREPA
jgi:FkbM family methyltransferase